ncbi:universal stress protein [Bacteriovorax sp. BSW11_IV]|uniref:universal stress protein n=1 Tax=Bacteriovorax sp. BSW11_IV TaxID=1353529 RepID=UPI000427DC95|nr:universal stress protein [Bacteriovorax sp. BSW11_IV]
MSFKKVMIAVDFDKKALPLLSKISKLSLPTDTEIHLVHVVEMSLAEHFVPSLRPSADEISQIEKNVQDELAKLQKDIGLGDFKNVKLKCMISPNAKQDFLQYSEDKGVELIVAAAKEREGLKGVFEGSFTSFLNKFSAANLLTLR